MLFAEPDDSVDVGERLLQAGRVGIGDGAELLLVFGREELVEDGVLAA